MVFWQIELCHICLSKSEKVKIMNDWGNKNQVHNKMSIFLSYQVLRPFNWVGEGQNLVWIIWSNNEAFPAFSAISQPRLISKTQWMKERVASLENLVSVHCMTLLRVRYHSETFWLNFLQFIVSLVGWDVLKRSLLQKTSWFIFLRWGISAWWKISLPGNQLRFILIRKCNQPGLFCSGENDYIVLNDEYWICPYLSICQVSCLLLLSHILEFYCK